MNNSDKLKAIEALFIGLEVRVRENGYPYVNFSLTDFLPPLRPELVEFMAELLIAQQDFSQTTLLVSEADRGGGPLCHAIAAKLRLPYTLANWYPDDLPGQIKVRIDAGFAGSGHIYLNGVTTNDRVVVVDDLLSTGGTCLALIDAVYSAGAKVQAALFVGEKTSEGGRQKIQSKYDLPLLSLVKFRVDGKITVKAE